MMTMSCDDRCATLENSFIFNDVLSVPDIDVWRPLCSDCIIMVLTPLYNRDFTAKYDLTI